MNVSANAGAAANSRGKKILLVDDDQALRSVLAEQLDLYDGFTTIQVGTAAEGLEKAKQAHYDAVLLDLGLPDMDGRDVCRELRRHTKAPIIMLTARAEEFDRILGLEMGADDYVTKPFSFRELVARIRAVARRTGESTPPDTATAVQVIGPLSIDRRTRRVRLGDDDVRLTAKEFDLLAYLATDVGAVRTRTEILESVWDAHWYGPTKTVDAHVASLRKKLGGHEWIQAVRGVGMFREPLPLRTVAVYPSWDRFVFMVNPKTGIRTLTKLDLVEISLVTFPANDDARVEAVKFKLAHGELPTEREMEKYLREVGFSKTRAAGVVAHGLTEMRRRESERDTTATPGLKALSDTLAGFKL